MVVSGARPNRVDGALPYIGSFRKSEQTNSTLPWRSGTITGESSPVAWRTSRPDVITPGKDSTSVTDFPGRKVGRPDMEQGLRRDCRPQPDNLSTGKKEREETVFDIFQPPAFVAWGSACRSGDSVQKEETINSGGPFRSRSCRRNSCRRRRKSTRVSRNAECCYFRIFPPRTMTTGVDAPSAVSHNPRLAYRPPLSAPPRQAAGFELCRRQPSIFRGHWPKPKNFDVTDSKIAPLPFGGGSPPPQNVYGICRNSLSRTQFHMNGIV